MKIIKINNQEQTSGVIKALFNDALTIQPNAKIALHNLVAVIDDKSIVIEDGDTLDFQLAAGDPNSRVTATITPGIYDLRTFIEKLNLAMNSALNFAIADVFHGFQWNIFIKDNRLHVNYDRTDRDGYSLDTLSTLQLMDFDNNTGLFSKQAGAVDGSYDAYVLTKRYFTRGCGYLIGTTHYNGASNMGNAEFANYKMCSGLVPVAGTSATPNTLDPTSFTWAIFCDQNQGGTNVVYYLRFYDTATDTIVSEPTATALRDDDDLIITLSDGKLTLAYDRAGNETVLREIELEDVPPEYNPYLSKLYCGISLARNNSQFENGLFYNDPLYKIGLGTEPSHYYHNESVPYNDAEEEGQLGAVVPTLVQLFYDVDSVRRDMGFLHDHYREPQALTRGTFIGEQSIYQVTRPNNMKVEINNISLDSYDTFTHARRSIIATIPAINYDMENKYKVVYQTPFPIFVDIQNAHPLVLNQISLSLLNFKDEQLKLEKEQTDITLLIDE